jgi:phosphopentomutase
MARAFILVMDSFGIGETPDAGRFGDAGADTLGHIAEHRLAADGRALALPELERLGLGAAAQAATGRWPAGFTRRDGFGGYHAAAREVSRGKDTPSGHWEIAGVPVETDWGYFPDTVPSFPPTLTEALIARAGLPGVLGNCHASGTEIIARLGDEHVRTGQPIVYTSADSVFQIAAHEASFGLERLYELCRIAFELVAPYNIGRVIARPFAGTSGSYARTYNRRDLAVPPPAPTLLDIAQQAGAETIAIGKIGDIFAHRGVSKLLKANGNMALFDALMGATETAPERSLVFANFVDFDQSYGHRRDIAGYAAALEAFDARLPEFLAALRPGDLAVITADHGCDPSFRGTDHTREHVPVLCFGPAAPDGSGGVRGSFADIGQTVAQHLGLPALDAGVAIFDRQAA